MMDLRDRPVFICGHPKSGTSLFRNLLDNHPQLVVYPEESVFFRRYLPEAAGLTEGELFDLALRRLVHIFEWDPENPPAHQNGFPDRDYTDISTEEINAALEELLESGEIRHPGDVLAGAVLAFGQVTGYQLDEVRAWVEKTPGNEHFASRIFAWWPEARCIHLVRDPRDNYASYQRKHESWTPGKFSANWIRSTRAGYANQARYGADRYWVLRYEDLVTGPEDVLEMLCQFLGIEDYPGLRVPTRAGKPWQGNSMFDVQFEAISPVGVGRWKEKLTDSEVGLIQAATRPDFRRLGYPADQRGTLADQLAGWMWRLRGQLYDLRQGLKAKA